MSSGGEWASWFIISLALLQCRRMMRQVNPLDMSLGKLPDICYFVCEICWFCTNFVSIPSDEFIKLNRLSRKVGVGKRRLTGRNRGIITNETAASRPSPLDMSLGKSSLRYEFLLKWVTWCTNFLFISLDEIIKLRKETRKTTAAKKRLVGRKRSTFGRKAAGLGQSRRQTAAAQAILKRARRTTATAAAAAAGALLRRGTSKSYVQCSFSFIMHRV